MSLSTPAPGLAFRGLAKSIALCDNDLSIGFDRRQKGEDEMKQPIRDFAELMREEEERAMAAERPKIEAELSAWHALPIEERERIMREKEDAAEAERARMIAVGAMEDPDAATDEDEDENEDDESEDEGEDE
jgi:hypothetical protein